MFFEYINSKIYTNRSPQVNNRGLLYLKYILEFLKWLLKSIANNNDIKIVIMQKTTKGILMFCTNFDGDKKYTKKDKAQNKE